MRFIDAEQVLRLAAAMKNSPYAAYLRRVAEGFEPA
jgi:hypothetical protein